MSDTVIDVRWEKVTIRTHDDGGGFRLYKAWYLHDPATAAYGSEVRDAVLLLLNNHKEPS